MKRTLSALEKEHQQLILCHQLIASRSFSSQEELRQEFQRAGYRNIGQSTISQLLKTLGVMKVQNAKGKKIYALNEQSQLVPDALRSVSEMVTDVDHNPQFVVVHVMSGYGRAVGTDYRSAPFAGGARGDRVEHFRAGSTTGNDSAGQSLQDNQADTGDKGKPQQQPFALGHFSA